MRDPSRRTTRQDDDEAGEEMSPHVREGRRPRDDAAALRARRRRPDPQGHPDAVPSSSNAPVTLAITMGDVRITNYTVGCDAEATRCPTCTEKWDGDLRDRRLDVPEPAGGKRPELPDSGGRCGSRLRRCRRAAARLSGLPGQTMALSNYRDISPPLGDVGAGFQFEFFCESCGDTWKTPFKPYRAGQANGIFRRFGYLFNEFAKISVISEIDLSPRPRRRHVDRGDRLQGQGRGARGSAWRSAAQRYEKCSNCRTMVCANCYDEATQRCLKCDRAQGVGSQSGTSASASVDRLPELPDALAGRALLPRVRLRHGEHAQELPGLQRDDASPGALLHRLRTRLLASAAARPRHSNENAFAMSDPRTDAEAALQGRRSGRRRSST